MSLSKQPDFESDKKTNYSSNEQNNNEDLKKATKLLYTKYGIDIPKGENLTTLRGCTCKSEFIANGEKIKNTCTLSDDWIPWCETKEKDCGFSKLGGEKVASFDYCLTPDFQAQLAGDGQIGKSYYIDFFIGFSVYFLVFIIIVPYFLYKNQFDDFLEVYLPNVDLLATSLSFNAGPPKSWIFRSLYPFNPLTTLGQGSRVFINYIALIGVGYLVARRTYKTESLFNGWSIGLIMLFWTYLIPNEIISIVQMKVSQFLKKYLKINAQVEWGGYILCVLVGFFISGIFIITEKFLILEHHYFADPVINMFKKIKHYLDSTIKK